MAGNRFTAGRRHPRSSQILRIGAVVAATLVLSAACIPPSQLPDGTVPQIRPLGVNGMATEPGATGGEVWGADLFGGQLLRFDIDSGRIAERYGRIEGLCGTDDLVVLADGDLVATCPASGDVIRVRRTGRAEVLARVGEGVNPIELDPSGNAVLVGFGTDAHDELLRIPLDDSAVEVVADDLPVLNGFALGPDGRLYAPTGGALGMLGTGGLAMIDLETGAFEQLELDFAEADKTGFNFACGADVASDGTVFVAQCMDPSLWKVDPLTGATSLVGRSPLPLADNVTVLDDTTVLLSGFLGPNVVVFTLGADGSWDRSVTHVGS